MLIFSLHSLRKVLPFWQGRPSAGLNQPIPADCYMKIIFLTENFHCGGLDSFLLTLVNHWPNREDELTIICNHGHPGYSVIKSGLSRPCEVLRHRMSTYSNLAIKTRRSPVLNWLRRLLSPSLKVGYFVYYLVALRSIFLREHADRLMVVNGGHPGGDTCRAAIIAWRVFASHKPRAIYNFHNLATIPRRFEKWPEKLIDRLIVRFSRVLLGVSQACAESMRIRLGDMGMRKVRWIYNGISAPIPDSVPVITLREELNIPADSPLCLMLATYEPRKGHDFLLRAFQKVVAEIPAAHLVVCGYGYLEEIEPVKHLVELYDLSGHVRLQGFRRDIDVMLKQSDLLLVASQAYESFGLTSVEAMANRIPVVATRVGGIPEVVVDGEGGFCVDPNDIAGYADRIVDFLKNPEFRKEQAEKGYQRYQRLFSAERMSKEYAQIIS